jgi:hypothetical protein
MIPGSFCFQICSSLIPWLVGYYGVCSSGMAFVVRLVLIFENFRIFNRNLILVHRFIVTVVVDRVRTTKSALVS